jgi:hypothetical protein
MSPNFLFHPGLDKRKTPTGVPCAKIVHPASQDRVDPFDHLSYRLTRVPPEGVPEHPQQRRTLLYLWRVLWSPASLMTSDATKLKAQEAEAFFLPEVHDSALFVVYLHPFCFTQSATTGFTTSIFCFETASPLKRRLQGLSCVDRETIMHSS